MPQINLKEVPGIPYTTSNSGGGGVAHGGTETCANYRIKRKGEISYPVSRES